MSTTSWLESELEYYAAVLRDEPENAVMTPRQIYLWALRNLSDATDEEGTAAEQRLVMDRLIEEGIYHQVTQHEIDNTFVWPPGSKGKIFTRHRGAQYCFVAWPKEMEDAS